MKTLKNNKGFTLIEIVIVIVIIAILAAMLVPSMLSWIDSANQRTFLSACDSIETAVLTRASEDYATTGTYGVADWDKVSDLANAKVATAAGTGVDYVVNVSFSGKTITSFTITNDSYTGTYQTSDGSWVVTENAS